MTIEIANSPGHEIHNALHCLKFEDVRKHVIVTTTQKVRETLEHTLALAEVPKDRVELIALSGALAEGWVP